MDLVLNVKIKGEEQPFKVIAGKSSNIFTQHPYFEEYKQYKGKDIRSILRGFRCGNYRKAIERKVYSNSDIEYIEMYFL